VSVRELREIEAGERYPSFDTYDRIEKLIRVAAGVRQPSGFGHSNRSQSAMS
jgi:hypothetical protein